MDVRTLREQIDRERSGRRRPRRYSLSLRAQVVDRVRSQGPGGGQVTALATALGLSRYTILEWVRSSRRRAGAFHRVELPAPVAQVALTTPGGYRLEGDASRAGKLYCSRVSRQSRKLKLEMAC